MKTKKRFKDGSPRMQSWNYNSPGFYFTTFCTQDRCPILGKIIDGSFIGNNFSQVILNHWIQIQDYSLRIIAGEFVIMPDHLHFIIKITGMNPKQTMKHALRSNDFADPDNLPASNVTNIWSKKRRRMLIPKIIGKFKMQTAKEINLLRGTPGAPVWQTGYDSHVVMDHDSLPRIRKYIRENPKNWNH